MIPVPVIKLVVVMVLVTIDLVRGGKILKAVLSTYGMAAYSLFYFFGNNTEYPLCWGCWLPALGLALMAAVTIAGAVGFILFLSA